ncbi:two-component system sensor histidine kinase NtrB, partial [Archangium sp.]|uniref:two-component system sensor histidine kinase NtrB n=1 Tax=Archangium sp. TaxID=1872627 RepID=UPI002ED8308D
MDACLSEALRQSSPVELSRGRLLVGILGMLLLLNLLVLSFYVRLSPEPWRAGFIQMVSLVGIMGTLWSVRRATSIRLPALGLCLLVTASMISESWKSGEQIVAVNVMAMLVPMLSVYLLGLRWSLLFTALIAVNMGLLHPLAFPPPGGLLLNAFSALFVLCGWVMSWMFLASRESAQGVFEQALRTLRESEGQLVSLVESTDDPVFSLDPGGRIITANQAGREMCRQLFSAPPSQVGSLFDVLAPEKRAIWKERIEQTLGGQRVHFQVDLVVQGRPRVMDISLNPILGAEGQPVGMTLFGRDITALKEAEARLSELHRSLLDVSRQAGMAEMATGILHNVGNTLNSVNVSAGVISERLRSLRVAGVAKVTGLLRENAHDLGAFFTRDPRAQYIPSYLETLSGQLLADQEALLAETRSLNQSIEHIKAVVSMQQSQARSSGMLEQMSVPQLLDDALRLHNLSFGRLGIQVRTEYATVPPAMVDRHKLLQILHNLLTNARHAVLDNGKPEKQISVRVAQRTQGWLRIEVTDNGVGIQPEHLPRIFSQGFTTKKDGHGFGLHISALAAAEMGGSLTCASTGPGRGATFSIELPLEGQEPRD